MQYVLTPEDRVISLSDDWDDFANRNGAPHFSAERVRGRRIWDFVNGIETAELYRHLLRRVRSGREIEIRIRCDAPTLRRILLLTMTPAGAGSVEFATRLLWSEPREEATLAGLVSDHGLPDEAIVACSWCERLRLPDDRWVEIEVALGRLRTFSRTDPVPALSHGICLDCATRVRAEAGLAPPSE